MVPDLAGPLKNGSVIIHIFFAPVRSVNPVAIQACCRATAAGAIRRHLVRLPRRETFAPPGRDGYAATVAARYRPAVNHELRTRNACQAQAIEAAAFKRVKAPVHFLVKLHTHGQEQR
jgi:hypothetical protein